MATQAEPIGTKNSGNSSKYFVIGALTVCAATIVALNQSTNNLSTQSETATSIQTLKSRLDDLQVQVSGKTNNAFVFIKPHACNEKVQDLVKEHFERNGMYMHL
jgi:hypothetical protein